MKSKTALLAVAALCLPTLIVRADVKNAVITWTGNAGYHAEINLSFDDTYPLIGAMGDLPFGPMTNQGILDLSVQFFSPSSEPLFSAVNVSNSVVTYRFLAIHMDTTTGTLFGTFDVGRDSFAEGEPGSSIGQYYLTGTTTPSLISSFLGSAVDSGGQLNATIVPEPSIFSLCVGIAMVGIRFRIFRNAS